jgi:flagellar hook-associated protein 2
VSIAYDASVDSLSTMLERINNSSAGVNASYDAASDRLVLANQGTGDLGITASDTTGNLLAALGLTSGTTFTSGRNAEFTINDGDTLSSASNTLDASAHGIAGLSLTVNSEETQTIDVKADTSSMRSKIQDFLDNFNAVQQFIDGVTKVSTDSKGKVTAAVLSGNREVQEWARSLRTMAFAAVGGLSGTVDRLDDLGIDFKSGTSELEIKSGSKLDAALADKTNDVKAFFTTASTGLSGKLDDFLGNITQQNSDQQTNLNKSNDSLDEQIAAIERRLEQQRSIMESAFINMETAQSKIKQQQTAIDGMFASLSSSK